jgi:hypothetical protein
MAGLLVGLEEGMGTTGVRGADKRICGADRHPDFSADYREFERAKAAGGALLSAQQNLAWLAEYP